jgi:hypothetical protein
MNMFGGLTKTSSRIAIAAALGMTLGGFAMSSQPAKAADLGGDCCADLEERVAELEATTVRKGNKKVSVTLSGWVVKSLNWWDDTKTSGFFVGDKDITLSSHFTISGQATIAPGWYGGYNLTMEMAGGTNGFFTNQFNFPDQNAANVLASGLGGFNIPDVLQSYMWIKSDKYGTVNWGLLSPATDNVALLPDLSGTIIESNAVLFEGPGFFLANSHNIGGKNGNGAANGGGRNALSALTWGNFANCDSVAPIGAHIGADCNTALPINGLRYDSPTFAGFSMSTTVGEQTFWDIAVKYAADWNSIKVSAAAGYTKMLDEDYGLNGLRFPGPGFRKDDDVVEVGASIMHVPSGLWVYGMWQQIDVNGSNQVTNQNTFGNFGNASNSNNSWFLKAGLKRTWTPLGATVIWGEVGQYLNQFNDIAGVDICEIGVSEGNAISTGGGSACQNGNTQLFVKSSTINRVGAGVVQEIDAAAMHVFARWQMLSLDNSYLGCNEDTTDCTVPGNFTHESQSYNDLNIFQVGGVIFF